MLYRALNNRPALARRQLPQTSGRRLPGVGQKRPNSSTEGPNSEAAGVKIDWKKALATPYLQGNIGATANFAKTTASRAAGQLTFNFPAALNLAKVLDSNNIPYVYIGSLAMNYYGVERKKRKLECLVRPEGLSQFANYKHADFHPLFEFGRKTWCDPRTNVCIDFHLAGEPTGGDVLSRNLAYLPDPMHALHVTPEKINVISVPSLLETKLVSSMSAPYSYITKDQDRADVRDLIFALNLTDPFVVELNPQVRAEYLELVDEVNRRRVSTVSFDRVKVMNY